MVIEVIYCRHCGSDDVVKNGLAPNNGKQKYLCHACGRQSREDPSPNGYTQERKEEILRAYQERSSLRGLRRTFGVSPTTVISWAQKRRLSSNSKILCSSRRHPPRARHSNWTSYGPSSTAKARKCGYGWLCVGRAARSWPSP